MVEKSNCLWASPADRRRCGRDWPRSPDIRPRQARRPAPESATSRAGAMCWPPAMTA